VAGTLRVEVIQQEYEDGKIAAGFLENHPTDSVYLELNRNEENIVLAMRPDEAAAVLWCLSGMLWSLEMIRLTTHEQPTTK
jgi:hypothetical protein